jgi:hypothetical protein
MYLRAAVDRILNHNEEHLLQTSRNDFDLDNGLKINESDEWQLMF